MSSVLCQTSGFEDEVHLLLSISKGAKTRKEILKILQYYMRNCNQIANEIGVNWWTVQKHLQRLEKAGLIIGLSLGRIRFYKISLKGEMFLKVLES
jgi:predicted transcriptional regulator